jgi:hypothetical protein
VRHCRLRLQSRVGGNFEDYIRFLSCLLFCPVNHGQNWKGWERSAEKGLIISDNQDETYLIITINDTSIGDLPLIITISDTCKNQPKRLDSDSTINLSSLMVILVYYESINSEIKIRPMYECRCNERLKTKPEESTLLTYTGWIGELEQTLEQLKIKTRLIDEKFTIVMGEYVFLK